MSYYGYKDRNEYLQCKYGIDEDMYQAKLEEQEGVCAICKFKPRMRRLAVDHRHVKNYESFSPKDKRKEVRGLCCSFCNKYCVGILEKKYLFPRIVVEGLYNYFLRYKIKNDI